MHVTMKERRLTKKTYNKSGNCNNLDERHDHHEVRDSKGILEETSLKRPVVERLKTVSGTRELRRVEHRSFMSRSPEYRLHLVDRAKLEENYLFLGVSADVALTIHPNVAIDAAGAGAAEMKIPTAFALDVGSDNWIHAWNGV